MKERIKFTVGLDVHKESIAMAYAKADTCDEPQFLGNASYDDRRPADNA